MTTTISDANRVLAQELLDTMRARFAQKEADFEHRMIMNSEGGIHCTDLGNARRFVQLHGDDIRFVAPWNKWLIWDRRRWKPDETRAIERLAKDVPKQLLADAQIAHDEATRKQFARWAITSESRTRLSDAVFLARSEPGIPIEPKQLDVDPWALNVLNGTIDLRTGERREHRREDQLTKLCEVRYDRSADCPRFLRFLSEIMRGNQSLVDYLRRVVGYAASGSVREQKLFFFQGGGSNGKSTLLGILRDTLGPDYAMESLPELLLVKRGEAHPTERADLFGKRFVSTVEVEDGRRLAESLTKHLTGDTSIRARRMREDPWSFTPTHTFFLAANHKPTIRGTDFAIWRRIRLVPFEATFEGAGDDKQLPEKLAQEKPGILAWIVAGAIEWYQDGLLDPPEVLAATEEYRLEMDTLGDFLDEECVTGDDRFTVTAADLYGAYLAWLKRTAGGEPMTKTAFGRELARRGMTSFQTSRGHRAWRGIGLQARSEAESSAG